MVECVNNLNIKKQQTEWENYYKSDVDEEYKNHKIYSINDLLKNLNSNYI